MFVLIITSSLMQHILHLSHLHSHLSSIEYITFAHTIRVCFLTLLVKEKPVIALHQQLVTLYIHWQYIVGIY